MYNPEDIVLDVRYEIYCSEDQVAIKLFIISLIKIKIDMNKHIRIPTSLSKVFGSKPGSGSTRL